jgi:hypothetical protein
VQIDQKQMNALQAARQLDLAGELAAHLRRFAPAHAGALGDAPLRALAARGLERAGGHGYDRLGAVRFYLECMVMLGSDFDSDPLCAELGRLVHGSGGAPDALQRADRLHARVLAWSRELAGHDGRAEPRAWARLAAAVGGASTAAAHDPQVTLARLQETWPEKATLAGAQACGAIVARAFAIAGRQGSAWREAAPAYAGFMLVLGHGCFADPQYPWLADAVLQASPAGPAAVRQRLHEAFAAWLERLRQAGAGD